MGQISTKTRATHMGGQHLELSERVLFEPKIVSHQKGNKIVPIQFANYLFGINLYLLNGR